MAAPVPGDSHASHRPPTAPLQTLNRPNVMPRQGECAGTDKIDWEEMRGSARADLGGPAGCLDTGISQWTVTGTRDDI